MSLADLRERLSEAGTRYDGHVTNGSLEAQLLVVLEYLESLPQAEIRLEQK